MTKMYSRNSVEDKIKRGKRNISYWFSIVDAGEPLLYHQGISSHNIDNT